MTVWPIMPDCGVYLNWPENGTEWIHPDDMAMAQQWIPSNRVFRRHSFDGVYYRLQYGELSIRVKPTLWLKVVDEHLWVGDQVEVKAGFGDREPYIARVDDVRFDRTSQRILYHLSQRELPLERPYHCEELVGLTKRPELLPRDPNESAVIIQPPTELDGS